MQELHHEPNLELAEDFLAFVAQERELSLEGAEAQLEAWLLNYVPLSKSRSGTTSRDGRPRAPGPRAARGRGLPTATSPANTGGSMAKALAAG